MIRHPPASVQAPRRRVTAAVMDPAEYALMDQAEQRMWWYRALHARLVDAIGPAPGRLLDAGCGTGGLLARLPGGHNIGLEFSAAAARAARKSATPVVRGDVHAMPFAAGRFDTAVAADLLCHQGVDPPRALAELRRVLRPRGRLVVNMPAFAWLASAHDRRVHNARRWNAAQLRAALSAAGFTAIRTRPWNFLLLPLMVLQRKLLARDRSASDVAPFSPWLDATFFAVTQLERRLKFALPGGSVLATATAP